ncbi:glycosyltransferase family 29 protein [Thalassovita taeanensis]|uniref:Glycosyltransferase family 29 (Sialyltransferase) n=1 Tax=Thalassovita taeanensis TaxID=657014 RepID=A0A1H8YS16_9RHOB|nr:glycosyltransferase family 29 protein [Thalassovita taeanensis]SEP54919.1 Glycosyltransferase family 29 (sialyltransferase) [Thalassovita taeanensis]
MSSSFLNVQALADRARFWLARRSGDEARLRGFSAPLEALAAEAAGKTVAVVGNARSLTTTQFGPQIDAADIVIRLNKGEISAPEGQGRRTDWLAMSVPVAPDIIRAHDPKRLLWVTPKRRRLPYHVASDPRFCLLPEDHSDRLRATLGSRPSTGVMIIALAASLPVASLRIYGFDFFATLSTTGGRSAAQVPHDFAAEKLWVEALVAADPKIELIRAQS